jgi:lipoprotein-anchoring transpeptidase ErfK/SrfK
MIRVKKKLLISVILIFICILAILFFDYYKKNKILKNIIVDKPTLEMFLINHFGDTIYKFPIAVGTNFGNKKEVGDLKTPEGTFPVESIEDASSWKYDFENDEEGPIDSAYGPWFIRLTVKGAKGIGIHGTHENKTIGKRVSHGCVRMKNEDLNILVDLISPGIEVAINPDIVSSNEN